MTEIGKLLLKLLTTYLITLFSFLTFNSQYLIGYLYKNKIVI